MRITKAAVLLAGLMVLCLGGAGLAPVRAGDETNTPEALVSTYDTLADTILSAKKTEWNLVHSILATTYSHAEATYAQAKGKLQSGGKVGSEVEKLAALVAQLGNEGDAAVAAVRKRLLEGGHHHHSQAEEKGVYDEGFVIVTRAARKVFLDASKRIAKLGGSPDAKALEAEWEMVKKQFGELHKGVQKMG